MFEKFSFAILENGLDGEEISVLKDIIAMQGGTASTVVCPMK